MSGTVRRIRIVAVGDELLEGRTADTNSVRIQQAMGGHALPVDLVQVVPDRPEAIMAALERTAPQDLVFVTGGLGSTPDDLTRDAVAEWAQVPLREDPQVLLALQQRWRARGIAVASGPPPGAARQAQVPQGMTPLANPVGSAPGLVGRLKDRWLVLLPGVPAELQGLLPAVVQSLAAAGALPPARSVLLWRTAQVAELSLVRQCEPLRAQFPDLVWSWWLTDWGVDVRVAGGREPAAAAQLAQVGTQVDRLLGPVVFSRTADSLPRVVQTLMTARGATVAVAESCTAGLVGGALTRCPGSSAFFRGGFLVYTDDLKRQLLGVEPAVLAQAGAVSEPVARAMADGCRGRLGADYAVAVSGISGPDGGTADKPVGTTWIAVAGPAGTWARRYRFPADRDRNRLLAVAAALDSLRRLLQGWEGSVQGPDRAPAAGAPLDSWAVRP